MIPAAGYRLAHIIPIASTTAIQPATTEIPKAMDGITRCDRFSSTGASHTNRRADATPNPPRAHCKPRRNGPGIHAATYPATTTKNHSHFQEPFGDAFFFCSGSAVGVCGVFMPLFTRRHPIYVIDNP